MFLLWERKSIINPKKYLHYDIQPNGMGTNFRYLCNTCEDEGYEEAKKLFLEGIKDIEEGRVYTTEEARKRIFGNGTSRTDSKNKNWLNKMLKEIQSIINKIKSLKTDDEKINFINIVKKELHKVSPMKNEPVDCVLWIKNNKIKANDYNPNQVATPEMELLKISVECDGFTQPIVTYKEKNQKKLIVVDGFHRNRVGKEYEIITKRLKNYLPITLIRDSQSDKNNRIASTIRHNRARGKHSVDGMMNVVLELKRRNWSYKKIGKQLGMDSDEVLRLTQISGLINMFSDKEFSKSWDALHLTEIKEGEVIDE